MSDHSEDLALAAEFPAGTREAWLKLVDGVLKGAPFEKRLIARTYDGLAIQPLYPRAADARPIAARAPAAPWTLMQRVDHPDPAAANKEALHDLENGATGLTIVCKVGQCQRVRPRLHRSTRWSAFSTASTSMPASSSTSSAAATRDAAKNFAALVKKRGLDPRRSSCAAASTRSATMPRPAQRAAVEGARALFRRPREASLRTQAFAALSRSRTDASSTTRAARRRRNWRSRWLAPSPICARSKPTAWRSMRRGG